MTNLRRLVPAALIAALAVTAFVQVPASAYAKDAPAAVSDALKVKRPKGGEWFGLYLLGKKVGHIYTDLSLVRGDPTRAKSVNALYFKANVGQQVSERRHIETRIYEAKPNGRLLSLVIEQSGDGGTQTIEGTNTPQGLHIVRKRPGMPNDIRNLPASVETIESADQARVALLRHAALEHTILDGTDLESYKVRSTVDKPEERLLGGVKTKLARVTTISEKEKVPTLSYFLPDGATVEITMGETMRAVAEPEETAKRLDKVEVFGLTRVVLPKALEEARRQIPGTVKLVVENLPDRFRKDTFRQTYKALPGGKTEITVSAAYPSTKTRATLPLKDPSDGEYMKSSLAVDFEDPDIKAAAARVVGGEKDAYAAAKKIVTWVYGTMKRDYGASADRASDVLKQRKGDCTEHALLAVALLRASGIPAKRVDGVVYLMNEDGVPALYWHEWVEAYVGEWTQLDPTFNQVVADATHLAFGEEGGAEITPLIGSLKVVDVK